MRTRSSTTGGLDLQVTAYSHQGGRTHMEDNFCVLYNNFENGINEPCVFIAVLDGHGGKEASEYAKTHLMNHIISQKTFWSDNDKLVGEAIKNGFINLHLAMWSELKNWPRTFNGYHSTAGTTASVAFIRGRKVYVGHVGDSRIVAGSRVPQHLMWMSKDVTKDHKPTVPAEIERIRRSGGSVALKGKTLRVVWRRPRINQPRLKEDIPFLAVARSLGDFWSYNPESKEFVVSPVPDVSIVEITDSTKCLIFGSDGLFDVLSSQEAVDSVFVVNEKNNEGSTIKQSLPLDRRDFDPSFRLVHRALEKYQENRLPADNISVVTVLFDSAGSCPDENILGRDTTQPHIIRLRPRRKTSSLPDLVGNADTRSCQNEWYSPFLLANPGNAEGGQLATPSQSQLSLTLHNSSAIAQNPNQTVVEKSDHVGKPRKAAILSLSLDKQQKMSTTAYVRLRRMIKFPLDKQQKLSPSTLNGKFPRRTTRYSLDKQQQSSSTYDGVRSERTTSYPLDKKKSSSKPDVMLPKRTTRFQLDKQQQSSLSDFDDSLRQPPSVQNIDDDMRQQAVTRNVGAPFRDHPVSRLSKNQKQLNEKESTMTSELGNSTRRPKKKQNSDGSALLGRTRKLFSMKKGKSNCRKKPSSNMIKSPLKLNNMRIKKTVKTDNNHLLSSTSGVRSQQHKPVKLWNRHLSSSLPKEVSRQGLTTRQRKRLQPGRNCKTTPAAENVFEKDN